MANVIPKKYLLYSILFFAHSIFKHLKYNYRENSFKDNSIKKFLKRYSLNCNDSFFLQVYKKGIIFRQTMSKKCTTT